jgi:hypothetical protein
MTVASPADYVKANISLVNSGGGVRQQGTVYADPGVNKSLTISVVFGGIPAKAQISVEPASLETGRQSTGELSIMVFDAQGRQLIGTPFGSPITFSATGDVAKLSIPSAQFTSPESVINFTFDGSTPGDVLFTPSLSGVLGSVDLELVAPAHMTSNGHMTGDGKPGSLRRRKSVADAPLTPPPLLGFTPSASGSQSVDLSANLPPTGDQGAQNSCGAWSSTYAIRSYLEQVRQNWGLTGKGPFGIDTGHVFSPAFLYNSLDGGVDKGLLWVDVAKFMLNDGAIPWDKLPYSQFVFTPVPPASDFSDALKYRVNAVYSIKITDLTTIKAYLTAGYPVFWGAKVDDAFDNVNSANPTWQPNLRNLDGHALTLIGYNDVQAQFIFRNSWGTIWGNNGNAFINYSDFLNSKITNTVYVFVP